MSISTCRQAATAAIVVILFVVATSACKREPKDDPSSAGREDEAFVCARGRGMVGYGGVATYWVNKVNDAGLRIEGCFDAQGKPQYISEDTIKKLEAHYDEDGRGLVEGYGQGASKRETLYLPDGRRFETILDGASKMTGPYVERNAAGAVVSVRCYQAAVLLSSAFELEPAYDYDPKDMKMTKDCGTDASCACPPWTAKPKGTGAASLGTLPTASDADVRKQKVAWAKCMDACASSQTPEQRRSQADCVAACAPGATGCVADCAVGAGGSAVTATCQRSCTLKFPLAGL